MYRLESSPRSQKKWRVTTPSGKTVDFGASGYSDYTLHLDEDRKNRYISRHGGDESKNLSSREDWSKNGTEAAGFWSRWLLWNKPGFMASVKDIKSKFNIDLDITSVKSNSDGSPINKIYVPTKALSNKK